MTICLLGIGGDVPFKTWLAQEVERSLEERTVVLPPVGISFSAYDIARDQFSAERILESIGGTNGACAKVLGITDKDIFASGTNFVFGLAIVGGREAIVSTARLREEFYGRSGNEELFRMRLLKEVLHELGHLRGLEHCSEEGCVMSFSNSILEVDRKSERFCWRCRSLLGVRR